MRKIGGLDAQAHDDDGGLPRGPGVGAVDLEEQLVPAGLGFPRERIEHDVLEDGAEHLRGSINVRLAFGRQVDHLRVASTLVVERAARRPAMLVVADE